MALFPHLNGTATSRLRRWRSCRFLLIWYVKTLRDRFAAVRLTNTIVSSAFFLSITAFFSFFIMVEPSSVLAPMQTAYYFKYTNIPGFFMQDDPATDGKTFDYAASNLGLINRVYPTDKELGDSNEKTQWQRFEHYINSVNENAAHDEYYKLLYFGRHGEGYHNVAEAQYGTPAWNCHWAKLEGDGNMTWADARVTPKGEAQALVAHDFWKKSLDQAKIPAPQKYYTSPLDRCCATANLTFAGLDLPANGHFKPVIKELLREALGVHTCDRRSSRTAISARFPDYAFEPNFQENDPLWVPDLRESRPQRDKRVKILLDDVFANDLHTFISLTSHSGAIASFLRVLEHTPFSLQTGGVIPVFVKAEKVRGRAPPVEVQPGTPPPVCRSADG